MCCLQRNNRLWICILHDCFLDDDIIWEMLRLERWSPGNKAQGNKSLGICNPRLFPMVLSASLSAMK